MSQNQTGFCKQTACKILINGKCLEGLKQENCPHFDSENSFEQERNITEDLNDSSLNKEENLINVHSGEVLSLKSASKIMRSFLTKLVVFVGEPNSGKTTLLAMLNQLFQEKPFCDYLFAGSQTLLSFEKICFLSRIDSGKKRMDTERTNDQSPKLFHLCVRKQDFSLPIQSILFTDVSGGKI